MLAFRRFLTRTTITALQVHRSDQVNRLYVLRLGGSVYKANPGLLNSFLSPQVTVFAHMQRCMSTHTDGEVRITKILKEKFPLAASLKVVDISGKHASTSQYVK